jgi:magnesium transporter
MFFAARCQPDGRLEETSDLTALESWLAGTEGRLWVDVCGPVMEEMEEVGRCFNFHPLTIEDCLHGGQRPKVEDYDGYLFLVLHAIPQRLEDPCVIEELEELHVFVTPRALVTVHQRENDSVLRLRDRIRKEPARLGQPPGFLLHILADNVADQFFPFLDRVEDEIDDLEDRVVSSGRPEILERLFTVKRSLIHLRKSLAPVREVFNALSRRDYPLLDSKVALYMRDVYDHLVRASEIVDACRDLVATTIEAYLMATSNRLNDIMRQLTIIATIFLPLGAITGFFGMNFEHIPWKSPLFFFLTTLFILAVPVVMLRSFRRWGWLEREPSFIDKQKESKGPGRQDPR